LKKSFAALGLIILIIGFVTTMWLAAFSIKVVASNYPWKSIPNSWEIQESFKATNRLVFELIPGKMWLFAEPTEPGEFPFSSALFIGVSVIDPNGGKTDFTLVFAQRTEGVTPQLQFWGARIVSNDGGLSMEEESVWAANNETVYYNYLSVVGENAIGGIVNYDGVYRVVVNHEMPTEPARVKLLRQDLAVEHPYLFIVPVSGVVAGCGVVLSLWAARKPKKRVGHM
jgi:hypothetical protein